MQAMSCRAVHEGFPSLRWRGAAALLLALTMAGRAGAQGERITGTVRDSVGRQPVAGAVVSLVDTRGAELQQVLSDAAGRFAIPRQAGAAAIRVRRIGYLPAQSSLDRATGSIDIVLARLPTRLPGIVAQAPGCPRGGDPGRAVALWEQARSGLLAAMLAADNAPASMEFSTFQIDAPAWLLQLPDQSVPARNGGGIILDTGVARLRDPRRVFSSRSVADVMATGFQRQLSDGPEFVGPDPELLASEAFLAAHCLRMASVPKDHAGQMGVEFFPRELQRGYTDIRGILWLSPDPLALREIEFRFVERDVRHEGGGRLLFGVTSTGVPVLEQWYLRLPGRSVRMPYMTSLTMDPRQAVREQQRLGVTVELSVRGDTDRYRITELGELRQRFEITGARLRRAEWPDGPTHTPGTPVVRGTVVDRKTGRPVPGLAVSVFRYGPASTTDSRGSFSVGPLVPGLSYWLETRDTAFVPFGLEPAPWTSVTPAVDGSPIVIRQLSAYDYVDDRCNALVRDGYKDGANGMGPFAVGDRYRALDLPDLTVGRPHKVGGGHGVLLVRYQDAQGNDPRNTFVDIAVTLQRGRDRHRIDRAALALCDVPGGDWTIEATTRPMKGFPAGPNLVGQARVRLDGTARVDTITVVLRPTGG